MAASATSSALSLSSIEPLNGGNFKRWKQDVEILLGLMDLDLALREDEPAPLADTSIVEQRLKHEKWQKANLTGPRSIILLNCMTAITWYSTILVIPGFSFVNNYITLDSMRNTIIPGSRVQREVHSANVNEVACNESFHIIQLFNSGLNELVRNPGLDLSPTPLKHKIEKWNSIIYPNFSTRKLYSGEQVVRHTGYDRRSFKQLEIPVWR